MGRIMEKLQPDMNSMMISAKDSFIRRMIKDFKRNRMIYFILLPVIAYYAIFQYGPMYGLQIAFKNYSPMRGFWGSEWVGLEHFNAFFNSFYFWRVLKNTLLLSFYSLLFFFPSGIILALLINEISGNKFKRTVQSITYMPHFISMVVIVGVLFDFLARDGLINNILSWFHIEPIAFMRSAEWFRTVFIASDIWQQVGWSSIIYLAAISSIDPTLYEAAKMDGAGRLKQTWHVTIPGILPTVIIMLILFIGRFMSVGTEKILLMYNPTTYETADVIATFVYRKGILEANFGFSTAVGFFNALISFVLLITANLVAGKMGDTKLW
jgi:putative aldouronate transport system permease protein